MPARRSIDMMPPTLYPHEQLSLWLDRHCTTIAVAVFLGIAFMYFYIYVAVGHPNPFAFRPVGSCEVSP
jgi:hypothetical protein